MHGVKKFLSYFFDIFMEETSSSFNQSLKLYLSKGQYKLVTKGAIYSFGKFYLNFVETFTLLKLENRNIKKVLILGLGMGSIIQILEKKLKAAYVAIEIDPAIIELCNKYKSENFSADYIVIQENAFNYLCNQDKTYDLICMDIFCDQLVPPEFETHDFIKALKSSLSPKGLVIYNRLSLSADGNLKNDQVFNIFKTYFPVATIIKLDYNWMFVNEKI